MAAGIRAAILLSLPRARRSSRRSISSQAAGPVGRVRRATRERGLQAGEAEQDHGPAGRQRHRPQHRLGKQAQRPFRADQQPGQIDRFAIEHALEAIAAAIEAGPRLVGFDQRGVLIQERGQGRDDVLAPARLRLGRRPARVPADVDGVAAVQDHAQPADVIAGIAVPQDVEPRGVGGQHAADGAFLLGRVGSEPPALGQQPLVQLPQHHPRLDAHRVAADLEDLPEVPAQVHDQAGPQRLAGQAGAGAAGDQGELVLAGIADQGEYVGFVLRNSHSQGLDLEKRSVGAVKHPRQIVQEQRALDQALEVVTNAVRRGKFHVGFGFRGKGKRIAPP